MDLFDHMVRVKVSVASILNLELSLMLRLDLLKSLYGLILFLLVWPGYCGGVSWSPTKSHGTDYSCSTPAYRYIQSALQLVS
jgi:hypothetical protein